MILNVAILHMARTRLPEFSGYIGRAYPGQLSPRKQIIQPRDHKKQVNLISEPPEVDNKFVYRLGGPHQNHSIVITVSPAEECTEN